MPCNCGKSKAGQASKTYVHTDPSGKKRTYKTEVEASAATQRYGGTYRAQ